MDTDELETPPWLFKQLNDVFTFVFDAAATVDNTLCYEWQDGSVVAEGGDSLKMSWDFGGPVWLNPPYSNPEPFLQKAYAESSRGVTTVALIKGDPSTRWWNTTVKDKALTYWIPNRIKFYYKGKPTKYTASFPSVLAIYWGIKWKP